MADILQYETEKLKVTDTNPRGTPNGAALKELCASIERVGILNPLLVTPKGEILSGKRRYTAATTLKLKTVPVIIMDVTPEQAEEIALIDNLQRQDLSPMEEAAAYDRLLEKYGVAEVAAKVGKAKSYVQRRHALTQLIPAAQKNLAKGDLSVSNAELMARLDDKLQKELLEDACYLSTVRFQEKVARSLAVLAKVGFDKKDATLYGQAGACTTCPKRTGSDSALFADITNEEDRCTDTVCFYKKVKLHEQREVKKGLQLITDGWGEPTKGVLARGEWHRPASECKEKRQAIFDTFSNRPGEIITICTGKACMKKMTTDSSGAVIKKEPSAKSEAEKKKEFEEKVEKATRRQLLNDVALIISAKKDMGEYAPIIIDWLNDQIRSDEARLAGKLFELKPVGEEFDKWEKALFKWIPQTFPRPLNLAAFVIALNYTRYGNLDDKNNFLTRIVKTSGLDINGTRKQVREELLAPKPKEAKKA